MQDMATVQRMTAQEFLATYDEMDPRCELIEGEVVVSQPGLVHQRVCREMFVALNDWTRAAPGRGEITFPIDVLVDSYNVFGPDLLWYAESHVPRPEDHPYPIPDLVVEVRSPSTWRYDIGAKKAAYERNGLQELWLIDTRVSELLAFRRSTPASPRFDVALEVGAEDTLQSPLLPGFALVLGTRSPPEHLGRGPAATPSILSARHGRRLPLRPRRDRAALAAACGPTRARGRSPTTATTARPKSYVLEMLPYPSGEPHIGHLKVYSVGDAVAHFHRRNGRRVLHPMGYDAFGLPAENHAIKTGEHPRDSTNASIAAFQKQFREWGISIDWTREFGTHEPRVYRWTQWIFLELFKRGLAYQKEAAVNWDPVEETVLANEQVKDGRGERSGALVEVRQLTQWFFRITDYADRLLDGPRHDRVARARQDHAAQLDRPLAGRRGHVPLRGRAAPTTSSSRRAPTRCSARRSSSMAPEHPDVLRLAEGTEHEEEVREYVNRALTADKTLRGDVDKPKTGVPLGRTVTNPVNGEQLPMFVADYVLMEYGTGALMAVPAHDERDYAFAQAYDLPIRRVIEDPRRRAARTPATGRWSTPRPSSTG